MAVAVRPPARRRGPGRGREPAPDGAPARRAGQPDLPGRRRRPVDLRLAARRRATRARVGGGAARAAARRPRGQLPMPGAGRRGRGPARGAEQRSDSRSGSGRARTLRAAWCSRPPRPRATRRPRCGSPPARSTGGRPTMARARSLRGPGASCCRRRRSPWSAGSRSAPTASPCSSRIRASTGSWPRPRRRPARSRRSCVSAPRRCGASPRRRRSRATSPSAGRGACRPRATAGRGTCRPRAARSRRAGACPPTEAADLDEPGPETPLTELLAALLGWAAAYPTLEALTSAIARRARAPGGAPAGRARAHARDRPRDQGARIRPRGRDRHVRGALPEPARARRHRRIRPAPSRRSAAWPTWRGRGRAGR